MKNANAKKNADAGTYENTKNVGRRRAQLAQKKADCDDERSAGFDERRSQRR